MQGAASRGTHRSLTGINNMQTIIIEIVLFVIVVYLIINDIKDIWK